MKKMSDVEVFKTEARGFQEALRVSAVYSRDNAVGILKRVLSIFKPKFWRSKDATPETPKLGQISTQQYSRKGKGKGDAVVVVDLGTYEAHPIDIKSLIYKIENAAGTKLKKISSDPRAIRFVSVNPDDGFRAILRPGKMYSMRIEFMQEFVGK